MAQEDAQISALKPVQLVFTLAPARHRLDSVDLSLFCFNWSSMFQNLQENICQENVICKAITLNESPESYLVR